MNRDWETTFVAWAAAPSETEQTKCENAERAVRNAIKASAKLRDLPISVFTQGSYANRTNVRQESDVDVCVLYTGAFFDDYSFSEGLDRAALAIESGTYAYADFKNDVGAALVAAFGQGSVARGNKAFDVHANTYRVDADVVPCFEHRRYMGNVQYHYHVDGTKFLPDNGGGIINWPQQNYDNGVKKNDDTGRGFKGVVRILKRLRNEMAENKIAAAKPIPSFLIECLVWNVPNERLMNTNWSADVRYALGHLWNNTRTDEQCKEWGEINELKYLFRAGQPWTRQAVNDFLQAAWTYVGFE